MDCSPEVGPDWPKHVGTNFNTVLLYFILCCELCWILILDIPVGRYTQKYILHCIYCIIFSVYYNFSAVPAY